MNDGDDDIDVAIAIFFVSFVLIVGIVLLNVVIACLLDKVLEHICMYVEAYVLMIVLFVVLFRNKLRFEAYVFRNKLRI